MWFILGTPIVQRGWLVMTVRCHQQGGGGGGGYRGSVCVPLAPPPPSQQRHTASQYTPPGSRDQTILQIDVLTIELIPGGSTLYLPQDTMMHHILVILATLYL